MGTISTGVGLISGLDYTSLVDQLIQIESGTRNLVSAQIGELDAQDTAYSQISAYVSALLSRVSSLTSSSFFQSTLANSSDTSVLTASASTSASPGTYTFRVRSLASNHQLVSAGFQSTDTPLAAGSISIESAQARVDDSTMLDELNGHTGVQSGSFKIIDGDGNEAEINISDAETVNDVIDRINAAGTNISAGLDGDAIVLTESTGGVIRVREVNSGRTAADLGFGTSHTYSGTGKLTGTSLMYLRGDTSLDALNDGLGVNSNRTGDDFTIDLGDNQVTVNLSTIMNGNTRLAQLNHGSGVDLGTISIKTRDGITTQIDLTGARTVQEVIDKIEEGSKGSGETERVSVIMNGDHLTIKDTTEPYDKDNPDRFTFSITDVTGSAATDLGIADEAAANKITGRDVLFLDTLDDVITAINYAKGNFASLDDTTGYVRAGISADGKRIELWTTENGAPTKFELIAGESSTALQDLGLTAGNYDPGDAITGRRIIGGVNSVLLSSLNGGQGFEGGVFRIQVGGTTATINASNASTLGEVIDLINQASDAQNLGIEAVYDSNGTRLQINNLRDDSATMTIADINGDFAESIGLTGTGVSLKSDNLQRRYIAGNTLLDDLNNGLGIGSGKLRITDSTGYQATVDLTSSSLETLQDVIDKINSSGAHVEARINDTGDGLLIADTGGGTGTLTIADKSGTAGADLNIIGESSTGQIDGSYEFTYELNGYETLDDLVDKINDSSTLAGATVFSDGTSVAPYRLSISSKVTGLAGELVIDGGDSNLGFSTLTQAQDASIVLGGNGDSGGLILTSSSNTFTDIVDGLTINVSNVSDDPVTITVDRDLESVVSTLSGFVEDFNSTMSLLDDYMAYNVETETSAILQGDSTTRTIESRLYSMVTGSTSVASSTLSRLSQIGIKMDGGELVFDETKFREVYEENPSAVIDFFTDEDTGLAVIMEKKIEAITDSTDGLIARRSDSLADQRTSLEARVERLDDLLENKRTRLLNQFIAMEETLAELQTQSNSLSSITSLISSSSTSSS